MQHQRDIDAGGGKQVGNGYRVGRDRDTFRQAVIANDSFSDVAAGFNDALCDRAIELCRKQGRVQGGQGLAFSLKNRPKQSSQRTDIGWPGSALFHLTSRWLDPYQGLGAWVGRGRDNVFGGEHVHASLPEPFQQQLQFILGITVSLVEDQQQGPAPAGKGFQRIEFNPGQVAFANHQ